MSTVDVKRAYQPAAPEDGMRILVDRLWPRGLSHEEVKVDHWLKEVGPSTELRQWFGHDPTKWTEFRKRYKAELAHNPALQELRDLVHHNRHVTLVFGAKDEEHNNAVVLRDLCLH